MRTPGKRRGATACRKFASRNKRNSPEEGGGLLLLKAGAGYCFDRIFFTWEIFLFKVLDGFWKPFTRQNYTRPERAINYANHKDLYLDADQTCNQGAWA